MGLGEVTQRVHGGGMQINEKSRQSESISFGKRSENVTLSQNKRVQYLKPTDYVQHKYCTATKLRKIELSRQLREDKTNIPQTAASGSAVSEQQLCFELFRGSQVSVISDASMALTTLKTPTFSWVLLFFSLSENTDNTSIQLRGENQGRNNG